MSLFNKPTARAAIVALAAAVSTGAFALHSAPQAQAMPAVKIDHAVSQDPAAMIHQARVRQPTGRKFVLGQNGRYKEVRSTTRQDGPVIRDHRAPRPVIRDHRAPNPARRVPYAVNR